MNVTHMARAGLVLLLSTSVRAENDDAFQFFQEEAQVVSASRQPVQRTQAPATVYVVTQEDIRNSGAQNIWDALRSVPGIDVIQTRTNQAEISIRGLSKTLNNRTLILLDGRTVLDPFFDFSIPESIPVTLSEIDRIEVVEGPASAVYGANAISGVINIITKTPAQLQGGILSYSAGERSLQTGSFNYGHKLDAWSYKLGGSWTAMDRFENANQFASEAGKFSSLVSYSPSPSSELSFAGGLTHLNTQTSAGTVGTFYDKGYSGFARADWRYERTKVRSFWNHNEIQIDQLVALNNADLNSDVYNAEIEHALTLPYGNELIAGAGYRRNSARSAILAPGTLTQDLWSLYLEDQWRIADRWSMTTSGRVDRHPYTPLMFSPRGSLIYTPFPQQTFRLSAGTAFRNPTLLENSIFSVIHTPNPGTAFSNPPYTSIESLTTGNRGLSPEKMKTVEIDHNGRLGRLETHLVGFHYKLQQLIDAGPLQVTGMTPPTLQLQSTYVNTGEISAWGYQAEARIHWTENLLSFGNYSYQYLRDAPGAQIFSLQSPRHKANVGLTAKHNRFTENIWIHWVDKTKWVSVINLPSATDLRPVSAYFLLNAHIGYAFAGRWDGLELSVTAFNLLNHAHYELLPADSQRPGQNGEIIGQRWSVTAAYRF